MILFCSNACFTNSNILEIYQRYFDIIITYLILHTIITNLIFNYFKLNLNKNLK